MISHPINGSAKPKVTFLGAAQSVTGSMHLVEAGGLRILFDCGLIRGRRDEARQLNARFPFEPTELDAVVLSHAHIDHCGNLPNLVRQGYQGPIYCTPATRDLIAIMLADSARIHEETAVMAGAVGRSGPVAERGPLYNQGDVALTVRQCVAVPYGDEIEIGPGIHLRFTDAGHILGSAIVALTAPHAGRDYRITFTGDLGRRGLPFLHDPSPVPPADLLICESTYGGRTHDTLDGMAAKMADVVRRTAARGGKILIPAFSLGRTQVVVHFLRRWIREGLLPQLPLFVDSPLATEIAGVYEQHIDALTLDADDDDGPAPHFLMTKEDSQEVSSQPGAAIIVASGGMCEGGRIVGHLRQHIDDPRASIVLVSYQAPLSVGAQLLEFRPTVRFMGKNWNKWAEVTSINGFSGHADQNDFVALLGAAAAETGRVRLVHGEPDQALALVGALQKIGFKDVAAPRREDSVTVA